jgi:polysaccharide export outer membrane protein
MDKKRLLVVSAVISVAFSSIAHGQQRLDRAAPPPASVALPDTAGSKAYGGYLIGVGDIINIRIAEEEDASGRYQVSESGDVQIPLLDKPVHAAGITTFDFSNHLAHDLKQQQILKEPYVTVFIERGMTQNVTVVGPVARPGIYPIERPTRLLDILSMSGGLMPNAGQTITITHSVRDQKSIPAADSSGGAFSNVDVATLMSGENREANVFVRAGDQITVSSASVVYVVGAVTKPGAFSVQDPKNGLSVLRAVAMVEGTLPTASLGKAIIVRKSTSEAGREEIPVDLSKIMKGQAQDPILRANDILFVPYSGFKQGMRKMGDVAAAAAGQMTGYGLGLRIAP